MTQKQEDSVSTTPERVQKTYEALHKNLEIIRKRLNRPLTLSEKIVYGHLKDPKKQSLEVGTPLRLLPDRVCMQDATAQMAILQFMQSGRKKAAVPSTIHCDHLIQAHVGASQDLKTAIDTNREVYDFLKSSAAKYGMGFWGPGSGIIHQVFLEQYAYPGGFVIGTDSHTPNGGGLSMIAIGVGGADAAEVMSGSYFEVANPRLIGVHLKGSLGGWTAPKDIILKVCELLTTKGGTNCIVEYFGEGTTSISATGKATITNMGAELGATTSIFPYDSHSEKYLKVTNRSKIGQLAHRYQEELLKQDPEIEKNPRNYFSKVIEIDLSKLEPYVVGPHSPDVAHSISQLAQDAKKNKYPERLHACLIGSCTNSSYEDLSRVVDVAKQAQKLGLKIKTKLMISPGSEMIYETIKRDGFVELLESVGAIVLANACGPCIGQWKRDDIQKGEANSILTSFNRNFPRRNDGNPETMAFIGSPELVMAMSFSGSLLFNPLKDSLKNEKGQDVKFSVPAVAAEVPPKGFSQKAVNYFSPPSEEEPIEIVVHPKSERLQLLQPFSRWDGKDFIELPVLLKAKGKCTTDHISPAGPWLRYRGHLDKISDNIFSGAMNAFSDQPGTGYNINNTEKNQPLSGIAREYHSHGMGWVVMGDENYGEGSSREHAAMSPRYLGCKAVIVRSFARIHETNLKKQGVLPLTFVNKDDYDKIRVRDFISLLNLKSLAPGSIVECEIFHSDDKTRESIQLRHSLTPEHIEWFKAGSAMNTFANG
ncbi:MAG: aconitate hydratase [Deltaproteobacteria bacterium]|nr:aconitate hydratase [Deltaproteobacteria bacterium]